MTSNTLTQLSVMCLTALMIHLALPTTVLAATTPTPTASPKVSSKPTATPSATPSTSTTQKLKERIEKIVEEKRDQVQGVLSDLSETKSKRAFIAEVQRVSAESITVKNPKGTFILPLDTELTFTKAKKVISIDDVAVGEWALVIGSTQDDTFKAENILISATTLRPLPKQITLGSITAINRTKTELTLAPRSGEGEITFTLSKSTTYQDLNGAPIKKEALTEDMQCLMVATIDGDKRLVTTVRVLTEIK